MGRINWRETAKRETDWWWRMVYLHRAWADFAEGIAEAPEIEEGTFPRYSIDADRRKDQTGGFLDCRPTEFFCRLKQQVILGVECPLVAD